MAKKPTGQDAQKRPLKLEWVDPKTLTENPLNWRTHPAEQLAALEEALDKVGWAGALLYNATTGRLVDGHARLKHALSHNVEAVPVLVGNWSEADEKFVLATLDPIAAMAEADAGALDALLRELGSEPEAISALLTSLAEDSGIIPADEEQARKPREEGRAKDDADDDGDDDESEPAKGKPGPDSYRDMKSIVEYRIIFDDEEQQDEFFGFLKFLKAKFPQADTVGARLSRYFASIGIDADEADPDDEPTDDEDDETSPPWGDEDDGDDDEE